MPAWMKCNGKIISHAVPHSQVARYPRELYRKFDGEIHLNNFVDSLQLQTQTSRVDSDKLDPSSRSIKMFA